MVRASKMFNRILKLTLGIYLRRKFNISFIDNEGVKSLKPPFIILANHTNFWDPFMISIHISDPIYFVASDEYFRNFALRTLLKLVGGIPKTKFVSDAATINSVNEVIKKYGGIVGVYPEGRRNWDGRTLPSIYPTAKLVKAFSLPVVTALSRGACLSFPRWAAKPRKGRLEIEYRILADSREIGALSVQELYDRMNDFLMHDEYVFQKKEMIPYKGPRLAEHIELFLFVCPSCRNIGTLRSGDAAVACISCGYSAVYDVFGFLKNGEGRDPAADTGIIFDNPHDWDVWQTDHLKYLLNRGIFPIFEDSDVLLRIGTRTMPLKDFGRGRLSLYDRKVVFSASNCEPSEPLEFDYTKISGVNIQHTNQFEFYYEKKLYKFVFESMRASAYKWARAFELSENKMGG